MIVIIDTGIANLYSISNAFEYLNYDIVVADTPDVISKAEKLLLPGVGAFSAGMDAIRGTELLVALEERVCRAKVPFLGICLGMQMLAQKSFEDGEHEGLGWIPGEIIRFNPDTDTIKVPHVGFNSVTGFGDNPLFQGLPDEMDFYFVHSYKLVCPPEIVAGTCDYGGEFTAAIHSENIVATQFHPEKSQSAGLQVLRNFAEWRPEVC
jgi:glutamine amidotransferase